MRFLVLSCLLFRVYGFAQIQLEEITTNHGAETVLDTNAVVSKIERDMVGTWVFDSSIDTNVSNTWDTIRLSESREVNHLHIQGKWSVLPSKNDRRFSNYECENVLFVEEILDDKRREEYYETHNGSYGYPVSMKTEFGILLLSKEKLVLKTEIYENRQPKFVTSIYIRQDD